MVLFKSASKLIKLGETAKNQGHTRDGYPDGEQGGAGNGEKKDAPDSGPAHPVIGFHISYFVARVSVSDGMILYECLDCFV